MYEIRCLVKDKHLALTLRALDQIAVEPPVVKPVDDGEESSVNVGMFNERQFDQPEPQRRRYRRKNPMPKSKPGEGILGIAVKFIRDNPHRTSIFSKEISKLGDKAGYAKGSYSYAFKLLKEDGILEPTKNAKVTGEWIIHREKLPHDQKGNTDVPNL